MSKKAEEYRLLALRFLEVVEEIERIEAKIEKLGFKREPVLTELANSHYKQFVIKDELTKLLAGTYGKSPEMVCNDAYNFKYENWVK